MSEPDKNDSDAAAQEGPAKLQLGEAWTRAAAVIAVSMSAFHVYTAAVSVFSPMVQRSVHLGFVLALAFLIYPASNRWTRQRPSVVSLGWMIVGLATCVYVVLNWQEMTLRTVDQTAADIGFGIVLTAVVLESVRRTLGSPLSIIAALFIVYAFMGEWIPGVLGHPGMDLERFTSVIFISDQGIFSLPLGVSATYVFLFVLFAELLVVLGGGQFFIDVSYALLGRFRGGPAKVAVVASALMGTVSGSAVANVAATGSITIPLMKATGYRARFAAAVESVASTGGQIMPPIMSAAAFVMAEILGAPYASIVIAATIPALLYFLSVFVAVDLEAAKRNIRGLPQTELPSVRAAFRAGGHVLVPLGVLIYLLMVLQYSPMTTVFWSLVAMIATDAVVVLVREKRLDPRRYVEGFRRAAITAVPVATACAGAGIIIGVVSGSGLGLTLSGALIDLSGGSTFALLVLTMIASLILGMGLSTVAAYIVLAVLAAPALAAGGVDPLAAHLFVLYFGVISVITPPVALAAYVAAGIAGDDPFKVGFAAFKLGIVAFLVPYYFVYGPELLMQGPWSDIAIACTTAIVGVFSLVIGLQGYSFRPCGLLARVVYIVAALLLIDPDPLTDFIGAAIIVATLGTEWFVYKRPQPTS
ncbi:MAG: TRAP transporter permease [Rhodospirillales bacterium]|nr:TRAP transporter permease [Rhodospirillales bacterium]